MDDKMNGSVKCVCPYCHNREVETATSAPYVQGSVLACQIKSKGYIGCTSCVRKKVLSEVERAGCMGWFGIASCFINPVLIIYNLIRLPFIRTNYAKAREKLNALGIPDDETKVDLTRLGCSLAISMIAVNGQIDEDEIALAQEYSKQLFPDFRGDEFSDTLERSKDLPSPTDIATLLSEVLTTEGKKAICSYLWMISMADGTIEAAEQQLLNNIAGNMGYDLALLQLN